MARAKRERDGAEAIFIDRRLVFPKIIAGQIHSSMKSPPMTTELFNGTSCSVGSSSFSTKQDSNMRVLPAIALTCAICLSSSASASEDDFLKSIEGQWTGGGSVLTKIGGNNVDVSCNMQSDAKSSSFSMNGTCRALAVVSRSFTASVKASGDSYSGTYVGVSGKASKLAGSRDGNTINLDVTWANTIYGDREARMTIEKVGKDGLRIRTIDQDPESGKSIVTTQLDLRRR